MTMRRKRFLVVLMTAVFGPVFQVQAACRKAGVADLNQLMQRDAYEVVFFASWCLACKPHLQAARKDYTILVAAFDEKDKAEAVLRFLNVPEAIPCLWDADQSLSRHLGVKNLPFRISK